MRASHSKRLHKPVWEKTGWVDWVLENKESAIYPLVLFYFHLHPNTDNPIAFDARSVISTLVLR